jgi:hypothetical protein
VAWRGVAQLFFNYLYGFEQRSKDNRLVKQAVKVRGG